MKRFLALLLLALTAPLSAQTLCVKTGTGAFTIRAASGDTVCILKSGAVSYRVTVTAASPVPTPAPAPAPTPAPVPTPSTIPDVAYTDFDTGALPSAWGTDGSSSFAIVDDPTGAGRGKVGNFTYANGADLNRWIFPRIQAPPHFIVSGDLYLPTDTPDLTNGAIQRKLFYFRTNGPEVPVTAGLVTKLWGNSLAVEWLNGVDDIQQYGLATVTPGVWHHLEVEVQINSAASVSDGSFAIVLDGKVVFSKSQWRAYTQNPGKAFYYPELGIGYQREDGQGKTEVRYWDRVGVATKRIP